MSQIELDKRDERMHEFEMFEPQPPIDSSFYKMQQEWSDSFRREAIETFNIPLWNLKYVIERDFKTRPKRITFQAD